MMSSKTDISHILPCRDLGVLEEVGEEIGYV
jgi:hypothetical protein